MKSVTFVDYYGNCNAEGKSVGHAPKALMEYAALLEGAYSLCAVLPKCVAAEVNQDIFTDVQILPNQIVNDSDLSLGKRIRDKFKLFSNIRIALRMAKSDCVWFYRTDFFLFFYLWLHGLPKGRKYICLVYQQSFAGGVLGNVLDFFYQKGLRKFDAVIYTQKNAKPKHPYTLYMPDYYYDADRYGAYSSGKKEERVVCLGTMNVYKQLEETVEVFRNLSLALDIIGPFSDEDRFEHIKASAPSNITMENRFVPTEEYYQRLSAAKYTILPYDRKQYAGRTSGVLQEALFCQTIPIAPRQLLEENEMVGIGYCELQDLKDTSKWENTGELEVKMRDALHAYPNKDMVRKELKEMLEEL